jgi:phage-related protein
MLSTAAATGRPEDQNAEVTSDADGRPRWPHELRVQAENTTWRTLYFIDADAIVVLEVFARKTNRTPRAVIDACKPWLRSYHAARREEQA